MVYGNQHLSSQQYSENAQSLHVLCGMILLEFARNNEYAALRDAISRNFIARADVMVRGIFQLWEIEDYSDCWAIHRALLDRLFHLHSLNESDQFQAFEDWSFKMQYEAANRVRSDTGLTDHDKKSVLDELTIEQKERYKRVVAARPLWKRPKAEDVAKAMDLTFLYRYGYDFASQYVHPMANDGQEDFFNITRLEPRPNFPEWSIVLSNSILAASLVVQESLNASSLLWHEAVYNAVEGIRKFLVSGSLEHHLPVAVVGEMFKERRHLAYPRKNEP